MATEEEFAGGPYLTICPVTIRSRSKLFKNAIFSIADGWPSPCSAPPTRACSRTTWTIPRALLMPTASFGAGPDPAGLSRIGADGDGSHHASFQGRHGAGRRLHHANDPFDGGMHLPGYLRHEAALSRGRKARLRLHGGVSPPHRCRWASPAPCLRSDRRSMPRACASRR